MTIKTTMTNFHAQQSLALPSSVRLLLYGQGHMPWVNIMNEGRLAIQPDRETLKKVQKMSERAFWCIEMITYRIVRFC